MPTVDSIVYQDVVALNYGYAPPDSNTSNQTLYSPVVQELQQWQSGIIHNKKITILSWLHQELSFTLILEKKMGMYMFIYSYLFYLHYLSPFVIYTISKA